MGNSCAKVISFCKTYNHKTADLIKIKTKSESMELMGSLEEIDMRAGKSEKWKRRKQAKNERYKNAHKKGGKEYNFV